jgi:hypothetical protein
MHRTHISCSLHKANSRLRQLVPMRNKSSTVDINSSLIISKSLICSILTYASPAWSYAAKTYMNKLQTFQNKVPSIITKLPSGTSLEPTEMPSVSGHIKKLARVVHQKSARSQNSHIQELWHYGPSVMSICVPCRSSLQDNSLPTAI